MGPGVAPERVSAPAGGPAGGSGGPGGAGAGGGPGDPSRLADQVAFLLEVDRVKQVVRHNPLADGSRRENAAEHMWHLAVMAIVLAEHAAEPVDLVRVLGMLVLHDVVEIDTGDTLFYDRAGRAAVAAAERVAADRIFGLLPEGQGDRLRALWEEFEGRATPDARFAAAVDRLQPLLLNRHAGGGAWVSAGVSADRVREANAHIEEGAPTLWALAQDVIAQARSAGILSDPA